MEIPSKERIIWALKHPDDIESEGILRILSSDPKWGDFGLHRCPLCGYENETTNIHRHCLKAPIDPNTPETVFPEYLRHMAVPMYVVEEVKKK